jgi:hypothetical protein
VADLDCLELGQNLQHDDMQMVLAFAMGCAKVFCFTKLNCQVQTTLLLTEPGQTPVEETPPVS